jgi:hypothetical protein
LLDRAREVSLAYVSDLRSFTCLQVEKRSVDLLGDSDWRPLGEIVARVDYQRGATDRRVVTVNNDLTGRVDDRLPYLIHPEFEESSLVAAAAKGLDEGLSVIRAVMGYGYARPPRFWTVKPYRFAGQTPVPADFLQALRDLFTRERGTELTWMRQGWLRRTPVEIFTYEAPDLMSSWQVADGYGEGHVVAYGGRVYMDRNTGHVLRITRQAVDLPAGWTVTAAEMVMDFEYLGAPGQERLLPLRTAALVVQDHPSGRVPSNGVFTKVETDFRACRSFTVDSTIFYDVK